MCEQRLLVIEAYQVTSVGKVMSALTYSLLIVPTGSTCIMLLNGWGNLECGVKAYETC